MSCAKRWSDNVITEFTAVNQAVYYHDRICWEPIFSGLVIAIATQLVLRALGAAIGAVNIAGWRYQTVVRLQ